MSAVVFCIGGPYGHSDAVRSRADLMLRLSACVLNHQVLRPLAAPEHEGSTSFRTQTEPEASSREMSEGRCTTSTSGKVQQSSLFA